MYVADMPLKRNNKMNAHGETGVVCVKYLFFSAHRLHLSQARERKILQSQFICGFCSLELSEYNSF